MAKERAAEKDKSRKREKKVSDDKVTKKKEKKRAATPSDTSSDDESTGGVSVNTEAASSPAHCPLPVILLQNDGTVPNVCVQLEDTPMVDSAEKEETEPKSDKKAKREKKAKKAKKEEAAQNGIDADADTTDGGAMLFSIDTNPTPVDLAAVPTVAAKEDSDDEDVKKKGPKKLEHPSGLNRAERRRTKMIEKQRGIIRQKMGIPEGSSEKADEVQKNLDKWIAILDGKNEIRLEKKRVRKLKEASRLKNRRGKVLTGRKLKEREKQIRRSEKKA
ncbi:hypothetical protein HD806DRAFT_544570 [Xylariaceae sp. AK1471]|nr:hypothetical protein HD806DRAFT_544570 [Xylariaceae sp. AK1471]